MELNPPFL
jgi:hypothetical protein